MKKRVFGLLANISLMAVLIIVCFKLLLGMDPEAVKGFLMETGAILEVILPVTIAISLIFTVTAYQLNKKNDYLKKRISILITLALAFYMSEPLARLILGT